MNRILKTAALLAALTLLAGCGPAVPVPTEAVTSPDTEQQQEQESGPVLTMDCLGEIGKSFDALMEAYPDMEYRTVDIPDAAGLCLGQAQEPFLYFFLGTQDGLSLLDLGGEYGQQLRCAGIVSTVAEVFPKAAEEQPLEAFFSDYAVSDYTYHLEEGPGQGWIEFVCDGYLVWINTNEGAPASEGYEAVTAMRGGFAVVIIDRELFEENNAIQDRYREEQWPPAPLTYGLELNGAVWEIGESFQAEGIFTKEERTEHPAEFPFPASRTYQGESLTVQTFLQEDGSEKLVSMTTWGEGKTLEGIGIGSTLEELKAAYPNGLFYENGALGNGMEPAPYTRVYSCYDPTDGTNCSFLFFLHEKQVVTMEVRDGLDEPRDWWPGEAPLGVDNLCWEYLAEDHVHYFIEHEGGAEETVLEIAGAVEHVDLDGDGVLEILAFGSKDGYRGLTIYDRKETGIISTDVNEKLVCRGSDWMGLISNLTNHEYKNCVKVVFDDRNEVYSYSDGVLTYQCPFEEAMGWE